MEWKHEYGAIFVTSDDKCTQHLKSRTTLLSWEKPKFEFMWFLLFSLCFHAVQVPNCMTTSTIAHTCEKIPSLNHGRDFAIWEVDFWAFKFSLWQEINKLHTNDVEIQQLAKSSIMEDDKWATLLWMFIGSLTPRPTFRNRVEEIMITMILNTLFQDCAAVVGHALLEGCWFPMASLQVWLQSWNLIACINYHFFHHISLVEIFRLKMSY